MFREEKATALAALFLDGASGVLDDLKLMKLMYLADREALRAWGLSITGDRYFSMKNGPVLSATLDLMTPRDQIDAATVWREHIGLPQGYRVSLVKPMDAARVLSEAEMAIAAQVQAAYGDWDKWRLVSFVHDLPEYTPTPHTSVPISLASIFRAMGLAEDAVESRAEASDYDDAIDRLIAGAQT